MLKRILLFVGLFGSSGFEKAFAHDEEINSVKKKNRMQDPTR